MIQEFSAENFLSIGERQTISFVATSDKKCLDTLSVEVKSGVRLLRLLLLYGANASGKTNILYAIETVFRLLTNAQTDESARIRLYKPNGMSQGKPTKFSITFWANSKRYEYCIEYGEREVLYEKMMYTTNSGVLSLMYERKKDEGISFGNTIGIKAGDKAQLQANTLPNHTVLSTLSKIVVNVPALTELYSYLRDNIETDNRNVLLVAENAMQDKKLKDLILNVLHRADINISDFELISLPANKSLLFTHTTKDGSFKVDSSMESKGTLAYFKLAMALYNLKNSETVSLLDEIESSLHYDLMIHYLKMFLQSDNRSQLVCTTHNLPLLDEDWMIRRDMVYLVEKDRETAESCIYRASGMGLHKNVSIGNAYRIGKLGAKPLLGSTLLGEE